MVILVIARGSTVLSTITGRRSKAIEKSGQSKGTVVIERLVEPCVLLFLSEQPAYGYELFQRILNEYHYTNIDLPNIYRTLRHMESRGMIKVIDKIGPRQKLMYAITEDGITYLNEWVEQLNSSHDITRSLLKRYQLLYENVLIPASSTHTQQHDGAKEIFKAVMQYNVAGREEELLAQLDQMTQQFAIQEMDVVVIAHGDGIVLATTPKYSERIQMLSKHNIRFRACAVTMNSRNIPVSDLLPEITTIPCALTQIVHLQRQGYVYIRP